MSLPARRRRRPNDVKDPVTGLLPRERALVDILASLHIEFGVTSRFAANAITHLTGEAWAGSLAGLCMGGYAIAEKATDAKAIGYGLTEKGWALHAGVEHLEPAPGMGPV